MLKLMLRPVSTMPHTPTCAQNDGSAWKNVGNGCDLQEEQVVVKSPESEGGSNGGDDQTVAGDGDKEDEEEKDCRNHLGKCCKKLFAKVSRTRSNLNTYFRNERKVV